MSTTLNVSQSLWSFRKLCETVLAAQSSFGASRNLAIGVMKHHLCFSVSILNVLSASDVVSRFLNCKCKSLDSIWLVEAQTGVCF